ncbi:MAG TPA: hypothetical protein VFQ22_03700 [Longimicrobiales bacterium]|nr:hypothetical protein [Longimicrobiales bacterium]
MSLRFVAPALLLATGPAVPVSAQLEDVGSVVFPTSATGEAQQHFLRGVAILHSFGWKQAREEFRAAQELEPDFALAYWGESLAYHHPLVSDMPPELPRAALERLAPTPEERLAKAPTAREKGLLEAVELLWGEGDPVTRRLDYMLAMERLHAIYPEDPEIAAFYSLSMLSAAAALSSGELPVAPAPAPADSGHGAMDHGDANPGAIDHGAMDHGAAGMAHDAPAAGAEPRPSLFGSGAELARRLRIQAGAIAQRLWVQNPDHPGAPHYVIHAFDDPLHAPLALEAAQRFAEIAPAVSHARHMPTHIFIQLGMWDLVARYNDAAYLAARDLWVPGDALDDAVHAIDWGQYGDLQRGDYAAARTWIRRLEVIAAGGFWGRRERGPANDPRALRTLDLMRARYVVETEEWQVLPVTPESSPSELLATALSAYHANDLETLRQAEAALAGATDGMDAIIRLEVGALLHVAMGHADVALALLDEAEARVEALPPPNGAATPIKPLHELYGEILMDLGRPAEAAGEFEASLLRMPNRPRSLLGLGRAHVATGNVLAAGDPYERLAEMWAGREDLSGMLEARDFWRTYLSPRGHEHGALMDYGRIGM